MYTKKDYKEEPKLGKIYTERDIYKKEINTESDIYKKTYI